MQPNSIKIRIGGKSCGYIVVAGSPTSLNRKTRPERMPSDLVLYWWAQQDSNLRHADYESYAGPVGTLSSFSTAYLTVAKSQGTGQSENPTVILPYPRLSRRVAERGEYVGNGFRAFTDIISTPMRLSDPVSPSHARGPCAASPA